MLPIGQLLWLKELMSYKEFPPCRHRRATTWIRIMEQVKKARGTRASSRPRVHDIDTGGRP